MSDNIKNFLAIDYGDSRIGLAIANSIAKLASPLVTLSNDDQFMSQLTKIIADNQINEIVIGLPRDMKGNETEQTKKTRLFTDTIKKHLSLDVYMIDEAGTSIKAEAELKNRRKSYQKSDIDSLAATYILEDFLNEQKV